MLGAIGMDYKFATNVAQKERQRELFDKQVEVAKKLQLPLNLHSRRCERDVMRLAIEIKQNTGLNCMLHWFTHDKRLVKQANKAGIFTSAGPSVLNDEKECEVIKQIDLNFLLLETDSPVEFPPYETAEPSWIPRVGEAVCKLFNVTESHLQEILYSDCRTILPPASSSFLPSLHLRLLSYYTQ